MGFMAKTSWLVFESQLKEGKAVSAKGVVCSPTDRVFEENGFPVVDI